ncbi:EthD domain-containing protein [Photorhabdus heterorhabditis]|uniref:EthD domain-containing protein n=1 Tax=Photorhabdus heterorhabditis TaxID=880156 RepID=A0A5B0WT09_9GAMM|nr:EthD domain-containing protein [Photorhabdus heterorhabditis]KAA1190200.1 EthD domain-containing protein [Photorhabdus heterorhabditis]
MTDCISVLPVSSSSTPQTTVLCTLLSRADSSPLTERRKNPNQMLDVQGHPLVEPPLVMNAFEKDANLAFEKWTEYWRKVHGPRFLHALPRESDGKYTLLRYDQIHRFSSGPSSINPLPYQPPLDKDGHLFNTIIGHIPSHRRPQWDGIAYLSFPNIDNLYSLFEHPEISRAILPEDQVIFRELCPVLCRQHVLIPSKTNSDAILLVNIHRRATELNRSDFHEILLYQYAKAIISQPSTQKFVQRYIQLHNIGPIMTGEKFFHPIAKDIDAISIMAFASITDLEDFLQDLDLSATLENNSLFNIEKSEYWSALSHTLINQNSINSLL